MWRKASAFHHVHHLHVQYQSRDWFNVYWACVNRATSSTVTELKSNPSYVRYTLLKARTAQLKLA